jgi:hypothetical protein
VAGAQVALVQVDTVDAVAHLQLQPAVLIELQRGMVGGHMRVVEHPGVVERAAQRHWPGVHVQRAARTAVAIEQLDQREAFFGPGFGAVQPKPSR